jgi:hypothetical protein
MVTHCLSALRRPFRFAMDGVEIARTPQLSRLSANEFSSCDIPVRYSLPRKH